MVRAYNDLHSDFVRVLRVLPNTQNTVISGGYDFKINLFDLNQTGVGMQFDHGSPVESISVLPNGFGFASVGGYHVIIFI